MISCEAWAPFAGQAAVLEAFVPFESEISVIVARGIDGEMAHLSRLRQRPREPHPRRHRRPRRRRCGGNGRARARRAPSRKRSTSWACSPSRCSCARDGTLLINELAPRPHNSGHFCFDAGVTSQFEQQLRAVCGLPLGATDVAAPLRDGESARRPLGATANPIGPPRRLPRREDSSLRQSRRRAPAARWATSWRSAPTTAKRRRALVPARARRAR